MTTFAIEKLCTPGSNVIGPLWRDCKNFFKNPLFSFLTVLHQLNCTQILTQNLKGRLLKDFYSNISKMQLRKTKAWFNKILWFSSLLEGSLPSSKDENQSFFLMNHALSASRSVLKHYVSAMILCGNKIKSVCNNYSWLWMVKPELNILFCFRYTRYED